MDNNVKNNIKKCDIEIITTQDAKSQSPNTIEFKTIGNIYKSGDDYILKFDEGELTKANNVITTITFNETKMCSVRDGVLADTCLLFEKGERKLCQYATIYGNMLVGITTKSYRFSMNENGGHAYISYVMDVNNNVISENIYRLNIKLQGDIINE